MLQKRAHIQTGWGGGGEETKNGTAPKFKRNGYVRFTAKAILYILGTKTKVLSRNNVKYDKPLYSICLLYTSDAADE